MDCGDKMILFIGKVVSSFFCERVGIERMWICFWLWHKTIPDVWSLTAELHRRKLNRFARTRKRRQWAAAQLCGQSFTFHRATINLVLLLSLPLVSQASLNLRKSHPVPVRVIRDDSKNRTLFTRWHYLRIGLTKFWQNCKQSYFSLLVDDRSENTFSYYEFLQHLKTQVKWRWKKQETFPWIMQEALASAQQPTPLVTIEPNISECPQHQCFATCVKLWKTFACQSAINILVPGHT